MTNGVKSSTVGSAYVNVLSKNQNAKEGVKESGPKGPKENTRLDAIKEKIESGEYKVDVDKLAKKMAEELTR